MSFFTVSFSRFTPSRGPCKPRVPFYAFFVYMPPSFFQSPQFGVGRRGSPRFVPICSDFPVFFRFVPICVFLICSDLRSMFSGIPRFVPICSVFFRFVPICFQNKSEQIRETPFCRPLLQIPDFTALKL